LCGVQGNSKGKLEGWTLTIDRSTHLTQRSSKYLNRGVEGKPKPRHRPKERRRLGFRVSRAKKNALLA
jgi:hypothetical protein